MNMRKQQTGSMLLEALIAILIFSMGILAVVGLQAASIKNVADAKYRSDASLLANQLIGQMWVSNRTAATLQNNFQGGTGAFDGAGYTQWLASVNAALPGVSGVAASKPTVTFTTDTNTATPSSIATITIYWNAPNEAPQAHRYVAIAQVI